MDATDIIIKPLVTEKTNHQAQVRNTYSFQVHPKATKAQIKDAVQTLYSVKVDAVRTVIRKGKRKRTRAGYTKRPDRKRAIVALNPESRIELY